MNKWSLASVLLFTIVFSYLITMSTFQEFELRKHARQEGRRYCDPVVLTYQAERMPEQIRLKVRSAEPPVASKLAGYSETVLNQTPLLFRSEEWTQNNWLFMRSLQEMFQVSYPAMTSHSPLASWLSPWRWEWCFYQRLFKCEVSWSAPLGNKRDFENKIFGWKVKRLWFENNSDLST